MSQLHQCSRGNEFELSSQSLLLFFFALSLSMVKSCLFGVKFSLSYLFKLIKLYGWASLELKFITPYQLNILLKKNKNST